MLDWLIVGGGIHGTALSLALTRRDRIPHDRLRVLDPHPELLARWNQHTSRVGMRFLRSPGVHHLHYDPFSLRTFRATRAGEPLDRSIPRYERPALDLFQAYSTSLIERYCLHDLHIQGWARGLRRIKNGWCVETDDGGLAARRVLLAISSAEQPRYPHWAEHLRGVSAPIHHVFDHDFDFNVIGNDAENIFVIGGGISAAQLAMRLAARQPGTVTMMTRHALRVRDFDSDPCWVGPICLHDYHQLEDFNRRRDLIRQARYPGSLPPDVADGLQREVDAGHLHVVQDEITGVTWTGEKLHATLKRGAAASPDLILLATGFESRRPGGAWIDAAIADYDLPVAACGYPVVDSMLCWSPGLHVTGALGELEIGPTARNIIGARLAGERLRHLS
jgi:hypothetical protein